MAFSRYFFLSWFAVLASLVSCSGGAGPEEPLSRQLAQLDDIDEASSSPLPEWPVTTAVRAFHSPVPARDSRGRVWFVFCGFVQEGQAACQSFAADGSAVRTISVSEYINDAPAAGDVDGHPGDEVVVWEGNTIRILSPELRPVRTIATEPLAQVHLNRHSLTDLDGDGVFEIVTLVGLPDYAGSLQVNRGNGLPFSNLYPVALDTSALSSGLSRMEAVVTDLDGDGRKDIAVMMHQLSAVASTISVFHADGRPMLAWPRTDLAGQGVGMRAADLEGDGRSELVLGEFFPDTGRFRLHVLDFAGIERPGWPVEGGSEASAIADLDGDGRKEIVAAIQLPPPAPPLVLLSADGTPFGVGGLPLERNYNAQAVIDVDGDSLPEILTSGMELDWTVHVKAMSTTGAVIRSWPLSDATTTGSMVPPRLTVGEFTGDGRTDVALQNEFFTGTPAGQFNILATGTSFQPCTALWSTAWADARNSGTAPSPTPCVPPPPSQGVLADAYVGDGADASTNHGTEEVLEVSRSDHGDNRITFLRFSLAGVPAAVGNAKLRLHAQRPIPTGNTVSAFEVDSDSWSETGVTWKKRPPVGDRLSRGVVSTVPGYVDWDVSRFVKSKLAAGATEISFALRMDHRTGAAADVFSSREALGNHPQLVITPAP